MYKSSHFVSKHRLEVELKTHDGQVRRGFVFATQEQRVLDVLNDARIYMAFQEGDSVSLLNKRYIVEIKPKEQPGKNEPLPTWLGR